MKISIFVFLSICLLSTSTESGMKPKITFDLFDKNGDGTISPSEFVETHNAQAKNGPPTMAAKNAPSFLFFDSDGDSKITREEFKSAHQAMIPQKRSYRPDGMGKGMPKFSDFDTNSDGKLEKQEFDDARAKRMAERAEQGYPMKNIANAQRFEQIDLNGDGIVDAEEFDKHQIEHRKMRMKM